MTDEQTTDEQHSDVETADPHPAEVMLARLETVVGALEQIGLLPATLDAVALAAVNPDGSPGAVAAGELIEAAWGNAVSTFIGKLKLNVQAGVSGATTNSSGVGAFSFNKVFTTTPTVVANAQTVGALTLVVVIQTANTGGFTARVTDHNGAPFVGAINLAWMAVQTPAF